MNRNWLGCILAGVLCLAFWPSVTYGQPEASPKVARMTAFVACSEPSVATRIVLIMFASMS